MISKQDKIGLVLGGGGSRGLFHMGVIKGIQELGIEIEEISGTSIGAVIGLMYAANPKINFEKIADDLDFLKLIRAMVLGASKRFNKKLEKFLKNYIGVSDFKQLKITTRFNATDINNNQEIVFKKGKIFPALMASISIPGVFPPLEYKNNFLVDGGIMNNVPISLIKKTNKIIVSDISGPIKEITDKSLGADVLYSAFALLQRNNSLQKVNFSKKEIIYLQLKNNDTFILDFRKKNYRHLIDLGYQSIMDQKKNFQK
jgi:NTE family protein